MRVLGTLALGNLRSSYLGESYAAHGPTEVDRGDVSQGLGWCLPCAFSLLMQILRCT
jgi:hypothetical protein